MIIETTDIFNKWFLKLKDKIAKNRILVKLRQIEEENYFSYSKSLDGGLFELKIDVGQGYRIYYVFRGNTIIILLCGGDKSSQQKDIKKARELLKSINK